MWDLTGTQFEKGVFELRLDKRGPWLLRFPMWLGPVRGRLIAITFLLAAAYLNYLRQPYKYLVEHGWMSVVHFANSLILQTWILAGIGIATHLSVFFVRRERLEVEIDRHTKSLRWHLIPMGSRLAAKEGELPYSVIAGFVVHAANSKQKSPFGSIEFMFKAGYQPPFKKLIVRFLSDEQKRIYPLNIYRLTDIKPTGDWVDPDDEIIATGIRPLA